MTDREPAYGVPRARAVGKTLAGPGGTLIRWRNTNRFRCSPRSPGLINRVIGPWGTPDVRWTILSSAASVVVYRDPSPSSENWPDFGLTRPFCKDSIAFET